MYVPDFVTCEDQPAHHTILSAPLFLEQTFCPARSGPKLSAKLVCHSLFFFFGGGGVGVGVGGSQAPPSVRTANSISRRQRDRVMVHGHVCEIKEADYQTTCCFKARGSMWRLWRTKADLAHKTLLPDCVSFSWVCMKKKTILMNRA